MLFNDNMNAEKCVDDWQVSASACRHTNDEKSANISKFITQKIIHGT